MKVSFGGLAESGAKQLRLFLAVDAAASFAMFLTMTVHWTTAILLGTKC